MLWTIIAIVISALLRFLSFPKFDFIRYSYFIALVPLFFILTSDKKKNFLFGFISGVLANAGIYYWLIPTIKTSGENIFVAVIIVLFLVIYISIYDGIFLYLLGLIKNKNPYVYSLFAAVFWMFLEYIRTYLFSGFPWMLYGYTAYKEINLIQIADLVGGVYLVSFILVFFNVLIYQVIIQNKLKIKISFIIIFILFLTFVNSYGKNKIKFYKNDSDILKNIEIYNFSSENEKIKDKKITSLPLANTGAIIEKNKGVKIAVLQGNIDQYKKWNADYRAEIFNVYRELFLAACANNADLIILPETAIPGLFNSNMIYPKIKNLFSLPGENNVNILFGAPYMEESFSERLKYYNSAFYTDTKLNISGRYDKIHLVPFGEFVPLRNVLSRFFGVLNSIGDFEPGKKIKIFKIKDYKFSVNICFESIFPGLIRDLSGNTDFIINITNDAWYLNTSGPYQHFIMNIFRAIENRKPLIRCANTGISAVIEKDGSYKTTRIFEKEILYSTFR